MKNSILLILFSGILIKASENFDLININQGCHLTFAMFNEIRIKPNFIFTLNENLTPNFFSELLTKEISELLTKEINEFLTEEKRLKIIDFMTLIYIHENRISKYGLTLKERELKNHNLNEFSSISFKFIDVYEKTEQEQLENNEIRDYEYSIMSPWESKDIVIKNNDL